MNSGLAAFQWLDRRRGLPPYLIILGCRLFTAAFPLRLFHGALAVARSSAAEFRQQHEEMPSLLRDASKAARFVAGAEINIAALGTHDRGTDVLRDHQAPEGAGLRRVGDIGSVDIDRRAKRVKRRVDGEAAARLQWNPDCAHRRLSLFSGKFSKEDVGLVLPHHRFCPLAIGAQPSLQCLQRHRCGLDLSVVDQDPADGGVGIAVFAVVGDPHLFAVRQFDAARALDLHEKDVDRILEIHQLEALSDEAALLDFGARQVGHEPVLGLAHVGERRRLGTPLAFRNDVHEVGRATVDWNLKRFVRSARAFDRRLVISGQKPFGLRARNPVRPEVCLEELPRALAGLSAAGFRRRQREAAGVEQALLPRSAFDGLRLALGGLQHRAA